MIPLVPGVFSLSSGAVPAHGLLRAMLQDPPGMAPLPASPPIGGAVWTVVVPAILFLGSFLGTYLLYRRFSEKEEDN